MVKLYLSQKFIAELKLLPREEAIDRLDKHVEDARAKRAAYRKKFQLLNPEKVAAQKWNWLVKNRDHHNAWAKGWKNNTEAGHAKKLRDKIRSREAKKWLTKPNKTYLTSELTGIRLANRRATVQRNGAKRVLKETPQKIIALLTRNIDLPPMIKREVINAVIVAILAREVRRDELRDETKKTIKPFITAYNREYDTFKTRSLDAPMFEDLRLIDLISTEQALWAQEADS
ncbi:hypothetical protein V9K92_05295 [Phyllobacterium sp. CCNWLW109]|uniref:hypothetical protein n=1 Tax=Phyllobacterium sp. CCNWLW109 TaxID=3127479 RepID=UPI003077C04D